eukprot:snap_masked-scaffold_13-processed-gene-7.38-mRNA-1 protein AED:1.00 eAED:1.00 QI:0/0/0/0/1/1/3/0/74
MNLHTCLIFFLCVKIFISNNKKDRLDNYSSQKKYRKVNVELIIWFSLVKTYNGNCKNNKSLLRKGYLKRTPLMK